MRHLITLCLMGSSILAAQAVLPVPRAAGPFTGDASLLAGKYKGPGRRADMVVDVTQTKEGLAFAVEGGPGGPLTWIERRTFRHKDARLTFLPGTDTGPATELRLDTGGDHFILKRQ
jgi:hypothetical protein